MSTDNQEKRLRAEEQLVLKDMPIVLEVWKEPRRFGFDALVMDGGRESVKTETVKCDSFVVVLIPQPQHLLFIFASPHAPLG